MEIMPVSSIAFQRRLKTSEEADYAEVLRKAKSVAGNKGKSILIVPSSSLPQSAENNTGVGNLLSDEGLKFFQFAKKYWGINEIQIQPAGQYHNSHGEYHAYSGTSMDLGNHMIDIKSHVPIEDFKKIVDENGIKDRVNYRNIVDIESMQEKMLKKAYDNMQDRHAFEEFKTKNISRLESKGLFRALRGIYGTPDFHKWSEADKNLYSLEPEHREKRIKEIYKLKGADIDFYFYKQFLAEKDLKLAREKLNSMGLKLNGDLICGFSYDEVWAHPKAFIKGGTIGWGLPALDFDNPEGIKLLREKVKFFAERFDGLRVDASWTYAKEPVKKDVYRFYGDKILNIIDDEVKKVKGADYSLKNIMHEFVADPNKFNIFDGTRLKPYIDSRVKVFTSNHLSSDFGSNDIFLKRGWAPDSFVLGVSNHDTAKIEYSPKQAEVLGGILKIPNSKLADKKEFMKAKFAEPASAYNNMLYFRDALALDDHLSKIPADYEDVYQKSLQKGEAFNPMDALEKTFKAKGLDKKEPELYKKIVKYRKILQKKEGAFINKWIYVTAGTLIALGSGIFINQKKQSDKI